MIMQKIFLQIIALGFPLCPGNSLFMFQHMSLISACQNPPLTDHVKCDPSSGKKKRDTPLLLLNNSFHTIKFLNLIIIHRVWIGMYLLFCLLLVSIFLDFNWNKRICKMLFDI